MSWSAPPVYTAGNVLTAAQMNAISANFNETAPAKASTAGSMFVGLGANSIGERQFSTVRVSTAETTASTTYTELTSHLNITVTVTALCLVFHAARLQVDTIDKIAFATHQVSGASTIAADDDSAVVQNSSTVNSRMRASSVTIMTAALGLNAGANTFKSVYKTTGGTLTAASRELLLFPL